MFRNDKTNVSEKQFKANIPLHNFRAITILSPFCYILVGLISGGGGGGLISGIIPLLANSRAYI